jgi:uncharacterized protein (DUF433 family)
MAIIDATDVEVEFDWTACELIERVPGKVSGKPVVVGTRIMPDAIAGSFDLGETIEELHEGFPTLTIAQIERLIEFGLDQLKQHRKDQIEEGYLQAERGELIDAEQARLEIQGKKNSWRAVLP